MSQLFLSPGLPSDAQSEWTYALVAASGALTMHGRAALSLLPKADQATLIVPALAISWHLAALPKMPRGISVQKMQAVLAGVLEEQLLDDAAQMHLVACTALMQEGKTWVAACEKAWLQQAVAALQAARVPLTRIVPEAFPSGAASLHVSGTPEAAILCYADAQGVLSLPLAQAAWLPTALPEGQAPTAEPSVAALAEQLLGQRVEVMQAAQRAVQSAQAAQAAGVSLAEGDLAVTGGARLWRGMAGQLRDLLAAPQWRLARWGAVVVLLVNLVGLNVWAWREQASVQAGRQQMGQLLTSSFPYIKAVVDAPLQMQRELTQLRQSNGQLSSRDFESIYARFSMVANINSAPNAIEYTGNQVAISGLNLTESQLESLAPKLQSAGLAVRKDDERLIVSQQSEGVAP